MQLPTSEAHHLEVETCIHHAHQSRADETSFQHPYSKRNIGRVSCHLASCILWVGALPFADEGV